MKKKNKKIFFSKNIKSSIRKIQRAGQLEDLTVFLAILLFLFFYIFGKIHKS